jgi:hypothetical protein
MVFVAMMVCDGGLVVFWWFVGVFASLMVFDGVLVVF